MSLTIRRGTNGQRLTTTLSLGEIAYTTDTQKLYVGDGSTAGGNNILATSAGTGLVWNAVTQRLDANATGGGLNNIVEDISPSLGGNLYLNTKDITGPGNIYITGVVNASGNLQGDQVKAIRETFTEATVYTSMMTSRQYHNTPSGFNSFGTLRARGTLAEPLAVELGDDIGNITFYGHDGISALGVGGINVEVAPTGTISEGRIPCIMRFTLHNGTARATRAEISGTSVGNTTFKINNIAAYTRNWIGFDAVPRLPVYANDTAANTAIGAGLTNGMMYYNTTTNKFMGRAAGAWVALN
jgi:hypothetical protein